MTTRRWPAILALLLAIGGVSARAAAESDPPKVAPPRQPGEGAPDPLIDLFEAAKAGDARAQYRLGWMHQHGEGVARDGTAAARFYGLAADQGLAAAQVQLGYMLWRGTLVPMNPREAFRLASLAAETGYIDAFGLLGLLYANGQGVQRNLVEAWFWFSLVERHHSNPRQREWARGVRMRAAAGLPLETIAATRRRVDDYRFPGSN